MARQGRHGATRRQPKGAAFDRWLDRVVTVAVVTAMVVGLSAVIAHWLLCRCDVEPMDAYNARLRRAFVYLNAVPAASFGMVELLICFVEQVVRAKRLLRCCGGNAHASR